MDESRKYTGVWKRKWGKWVAEIRLPNSRERIWLGSFDTPEKAARAFDAALYCLRGPGARFNFPENPPEIPNGSSLTPQQIQVVATRYANEEILVSPPEQQQQEEDHLASPRGDNVTAEEEIILAHGEISGGGGPSTLGQVGEDNGNVGNSSNNTTTHWPLLWDENFEEFGFLTDNSTNLYFPTEQHQLSSDFYDDGAFEDYTNINLWNF